MNDLLRRDHGGFIPLMGLVILLAAAIIAAGAIVYVADLETTDTNSAVSINVGNVNQNANQALGGDRDEHGCIGSAGYSWCEIKAKCLRTWEEACAAVNANTNSNANDNTNANANTAVTVPTDWKTYANNQYNYSVRYPSNWDVDDKLGQNNIQIVPPDATDVTSIELGPQLFIQFENEVHIDGGETRSCVSNSRNVVINDINAIRQAESCFAGYDVTYFTTSGGYIAISWAEGFASSHPEYEQILSTFQFTD